MDELKVKARFASTLGWIQLVFGSTLFIREHEVWAWVVTGLGIINLVASVVIGTIAELQDK